MVSYDQKKKIHTNSSCKLIYLTHPHPHYSRLVLKNVPSPDIAETQIKVPVPCKYYSNDFGHHSGTEYNYRLVSDINMKRSLYYRPE